VTLGAGHKTGLYLDQSQNHRRAAGLAADRDVLDAFCYTGGFACHALRGGARRAVLIDSSLEALAVARQNLALNGVAERAELVAPLSQASDHPVILTIPETRYLKGLHLEAL